MKQTAELHAVKMEVASRSVHDEKALFDEDDNDEDEIVLGRVEEDDVQGSKQRLLSKSQTAPIFEGLKTTSAGHKIQEIQEMMTVPVCALHVHCISSILTHSSGHCHRRPH